MLRHSRRSQASASPAPGKPVLLCFFDQRQFGFVGKHGFTDERLPATEQVGTPSIGPLARLLGPGLRIGDVLQVRCFMQVGVDELGVGRDQTVGYGRTVKAGLAGAVGACQQVEDR